MAVKMETEATTLPAQERKPQETIDSSSRGDIPLRWVTSILLLIFPTATLFVNRGDSYVFGLLILIGLWVWLRDGARRWLDRPSALLWIAFALFFAMALLSYVLGTQTDAGFRFLGRYLRFLLIAPVYLAVRRYPPTAKTVFIGLALGVLLAGVLAGFQFLHAPVPIRVQATTGLSIIFGDLAASMVLCTIAGFSLIASPERIWTVPLLTLCLASGVAATLLSGTRGAWIPLLLVPLIVMLPFGTFTRNRYILAIVLILIAISSSFLLMDGNLSRQRLVDAGRNFYDYFMVLNYMDGPENPTTSNTGCVASPALLTGWLASGFVPYSTLDTKVETDSALATETLCSGDAVIRLHNPHAEMNKKNLPYFVLPRYPRPLVKSQSAKLWVRGAGFVTLDYRSDAWVRFDFKNYRELSFSVDNDTVGTGLDIGAQPGKTIWFAPVEGYMGEYVLPLMDNSVGQRLEMWRAAWKMFLRHPLIGVGTGAYQDVLASLISKGENFPFVDRYDHPHSDYFNALASAGIVGLLALLTILVVPLVRFWYALHSKDAIAHVAGLAGALTVVGFAIYALTDTIFVHSMMITWYVIYVALFYALIQASAVKEHKAAD